jgi:hypothetical protein
MFTILFVPYKDIFLVLPFGELEGLFTCQYPVSPNPRFPSLLPNLPANALLPYDPGQRDLKIRANGILFYTVLFLLHLRYIPPTHLLPFLLLNKILP